MIAGHIGNPPAPSTPPRKSRQPPTPTPSSLHRATQTPPSHAQRPLTCSLPDTAAPASSSAPMAPFPLTLSDTATESHDLFGEPLYYSEEAMNMGLGVGMDADMHMDLGLGMDGMDLGQIMHMPHDADTASLATTLSTLPLTLPLTTMPTTMPSTPCQPFRHGSAASSMFLVDDPTTNHSHASAYGDPENFSMGPRMSTSYPSFFLPLPRDPTPVRPEKDNNASPPMTRTRTRHARGAHSAGSLVDTVLPSVEDDADSPDGDRRPVPPSVNGPPPTDPADWRARLRYCEQAVHKASLDASLVRLLEFPQGLAAHELDARRAANLRFDRVREQRLKDRNNEAAKRSRQRKVQRIERAELQVEEMIKERATLAAEVARLKRQLAAVMAGRGDERPSRRTRSRGHGSKVLEAKGGLDVDMDVDDAGTAELVPPRKVGRF